MMHDPIVEEIRSIRRALSGRHNNDLREIVRALRSGQGKDGRQVVRRPARPARTQFAKLKPTS